MKKMLTWMFAAVCSFTQYAVAQSPLYTYVDPFIGAGGDGHIFIGPSTPFGMVKPGPDCKGHSNSGYILDKKAPVLGFSQTHVSGTGGGPKYGNILIMPFSGDFDSIYQESTRGEEVAKAGYYSMMLEKWKIKAEMTTADRASFYRFVFGQKGKKALKVDAGHFLGEPATQDPDAREAQQFVGAEVTVINNNEIRGYSRIRGGWNNGAAYTIYFTMLFDHPFSSFSTWKSKQLYPGVKVQFDSGEKTGAIAYFDGAEGDTVQVKIGISFISEEKARYNLDHEIPGWQFADVQKATEQKWEKLLNRIEIAPSATKEQHIMFYTGLYHTMLMPVDRTGENPLWISNEPYYDDFYAIWDTFRSSNPLLTLITPSREVSIVNALLNIYHRDGYMPDARSGNYNGRTQGGSNADVLIADAYVKGLQGIDYNYALQAMLRNADVPPGGIEEKEGRGGLTDYNTLGYVSTRFPRAGTRTVEYAYNDYCIATVARGLQQDRLYQRFLKQSDNWQNLWRPYEDHGAKGFILPKNSDGRWIDTIDCNVLNAPQKKMQYNPLAQDYPMCVCWWCAFFYEASSWEYSLYVPHDVNTLISKSGGRDAFKKRLDIFFNNKYYNVSNEPSFLTPNLYHWIGRPDLSSERIHNIIDSSYNTSAAGLPGNDDSGAMSSWLDFHMIGLFPNAGQSYYLINAPYFTKTIIHQENGKDFTIIANNLSGKNRYIRSVKLNGKDYEPSWLEHQDIVNGGELVLEMSDKASTWGTKVTPPSK
ncbi:GH92 family glycosyl hydrolase [Chitinophaga sp.]|uniref:GH92 family glycosyl hydrolase n=1 Tax=Chitinophaga sp. TaxID=1869181 RepID=UPI0031D658E0